VMGSLKSPCATSYRSSIDTIALNCLVFETIAFFFILASWQQTNRRTSSMREAAVSHSRALLTHSLTAALDQLRVVASSTSNDPDPRSRQHQQIGQRLLPLAAANFSVDDPAGASSQQREECRCGLLLTVEVPAKQVYSPVGDRCVQIMNDVCQQ